MNSRPSWFQDLASLFGNAAALHTLFILIDRSLTDPADRRGILLWWGMLFVSYTLLALLIYRLQVQKYAFLIPAAALAAQFGLTLGFGDGSLSLSAGLALLCLWGFTQYRAFSLLLTPASAEQRTTDFETTVLTLILALLSWSGQVLPAEALVPPAVGSLLLLFALAARRTSGARGRGGLAGRALTILLPLAVLGICFLFLTGLADAAASGVQALLGALSALLRGMAHTAGRFVNWLFSLLPAAETALPDYAPAETEAVLAETAETDLSGTLSPVPFLIGILLLGAAALFFLSRSRFSLPAFSEHGGARTRLPGVRRRIGERIRQFFARIRFELVFLTHRNTPSGLLVWIERRIRIRGAGRRPDETSRQFLSRSLRFFPDCGEELAVLSDCLDRQYFRGEKKGLSPAEIRRMRQAFRKDLTRKHTS